MFGHLAAGKVALAFSGATAFVASRAGMPMFGDHVSSRIGHDAARLGHDDMSLRGLGTIPQLPI